MMKFSERIKQDLLEFYFKNKNAIGLFLVVIASVILLLWIEICFLSYFLKDYIYPFFTVTTSIVLAIIAYLNYELTKPKIDGVMWFFHKDDENIKEMFPNIQSETGFFVQIQIQVKNKIIINPVIIRSDKEEVLIYGNIKEEKSFNTVLGVTFQGLQIIRRASFFYFIEGGIDAKKYPLSLIPKDLSIIHKKIDEYLENKNS